MVEKNKPEDVLRGNFRVISSEPGGPPSSPEPSSDLVHGGIPEDHPAAETLKSIVVEGYDHLDLLNYDFKNCWTRTHRDQPYLKEDVIAAIMVTGSNYAAMSVLLGRNRNRVKDYVLSHSDVYEIFEGVNETYLDLIERSAKHQAILGDGPMQRFFLATQGKNRGYTTRTETTGKDGAPLTADLSQYSEEQLEQLAAIQRAATPSGA